MTSLAWKINRIRAMSLPELAHRGQTMLHQRREQKRVTKGWRPLPETAVSPGTLLFSMDADWPGQWKERYQLDTDNLEHLLAGRIDFFGHTWLDTGMPVKWLKDPLTGIASSPDIYGKWLDYRDEKLVGNVKILWELGRHQHLVPLAVAYAISGDIRYRQCIADQLEGWIQQNPFGLGIHWCSSLELALRLISWALVHCLLALRDGARGIFDAVSDPESLGVSIYQHASFINGHLSRYTSANNHLIGELTGLFTACQVFNLGTEGEKWAEKAHQELEQEALLQVFDDGVDREQAVYYHLWVLEYLLFAWQAGARTGRPFSARFQTRIIKMARFLRAIIPAGGHPPEIGDADDGFVARFCARWPTNPYDDVLAATGKVFNIRELHTDSELPEKAFWYGAINDKCDILPASEYSPTGKSDYPLVYPDGGYGILRSDNIHLVFDAGPLGYPSIAAHGHSDALSFSLAIGKDWWLVDPGTYSYHTDAEWRDYFRGTSAHNTLTVDGQNQSQIGGSFLWLRHAHAHISGYGNDDCQWIEGEHDGYKHLGISHKRRIRLYGHNREIHIDDRIEGDGSHLLAMHFHFHPDVFIKRLDESTWQARHKSSDFVLDIEIDKAWAWKTISGDTKPILGWYSGMLGEKVPTFTLCGQYDRPLPVRSAIKFIIKD